MSGLTALAIFWFALRKNREYPCIFNETLGIAHVVTCLRLWRCQGGKEMYSRNEPAPSSAASAQRNFDSTLESNTARPSIATATAGFRMPKLTESRGVPTPTTKNKVQQYKAGTNLYACGQRPSVDGLRSSPRDQRLLTHGPDPESQREVAAARKKIGAEILDLQQRARGGWAGGRTA